MSHEAQTIRGAVAGLAAFACLWAGAASAQTAPAKPHKVVKLDEISVEGRIQKPQAFYILPRSSLNYSALDQQDTFLPKIKKALKEDPF